MQLLASEEFLKCLNWQSKLADDSIVYICAVQLYLAKFASVNKLVDGVVLVRAGFFNTNDQKMTFRLQAWDKGEINSVEYVFKLQFDEHDSDRYTATPTGMILSIKDYDEDITIASSSQELDEMVKEGSTVFIDDPVRGFNLQIGFSIGAKQG